MRIMHTADWHLCDRLGRIDRTADLQTRVERVAQLCAEHRCDVLLIAGDLFSEQAGFEAMTEALKHLRETFKEFFNRGGILLAVTGNHDHDRKINMVRAGMTLAAPAAARDGVLPIGRMYLLNGRAVATIVGPDGQNVQFVCVPYPFASRYGLSATEYRTQEEAHRLLHGSVAQWLRQLSGQTGFKETVPTVLVAHLHVRGAEVHSLYQLTERDDVLFDCADLNPTWAYVALGHIHKPQAVHGQANIRYPGSLDRLSFTETHEDHGVLLIEVGHSGLLGEPTWISIPPTPFHTITLTDPEIELPTLADRFPDHEQAIVRIAVAPTAGLSRHEIARTLRRLFPRLHELKWLEPAQAASAAPPGLVQRAGFAATIREYLTGCLVEDPDREALLALAEEFVRQEEQA